MTEQTLPLYPNVEVKLVGEDGNAFAILGACTREMRRAKIEKPVIDRFLAEAMKGDYDNLLATCSKWFTIR